MDPPLLKYHAGHGLVDEAVIIMLAIPDKPGVAAQRRHFPQIRLHIIMFGEQLIPEQAVHGENSGALGELLADLLYGIFHDSLVIAQLQEDQYIGIVDLPEAGQGVPVDLLDRNDAGIIPIDLAERVT